MKFLWQDYLVGIGIALNAGARLITTYLVSSIKHLVTNAQAIETNPIAKVAATSYLITFIQFGLLASFMCAYYVYLRKRALKSKKDNDYFSMNVFTFMAFIMLLFDFLNDSGILLAILTKVA